MKYSTNTIIIASLLCLFALSCNSDNDDFEVPGTITIREIILKSITMTGRDGLPWDEDDLSPDVFILVRVNNTFLRLESDTITIGASPADIPLNISEEIVLTPQDTSVEIRIIDFDWDPNFPAEFQTNDEIRRLYLDPWNLSSPFRLVNRGTPIEVGNPRGQLEFIVEYN